MAVKTDRESISSILPQQLCSKNLIKASATLKQQATTRLHLLGSTDVSLNQFSIEPAKSVTLAKQSLWGSFSVYASAHQQQSKQPDQYLCRIQIMIWITPNP